MITVWGFARSEKVGVVRGACVRYCWLWQVDVEQWSEEGHEAGGQENTHSGVWSFALGPFYFLTSSSSTGGDLYWLPWEVVCWWDADGLESSGSAESDVMADIFSWTIVLLTRDGLKIPFGRFGLGSGGSLMTSLEVAWVLVESWLFSLSVISVLALCPLERVLGSKSLILELCWSSKTEK